MWYLAKKSNGNEGMIPANYVTKVKRSPVHRPLSGGVNGLPNDRLNTMVWFHGKITREKTEEILNPRIDGLFLIRESVNYKGDYTLCVCCEGKVEHYRVEKINNQLSIDQDVYFNNLEELVKHYTDDEDGLCHRLVKPFPKTSTGSSANNAPTEAMPLQEKDLIQAGWVISKDELSLGETLGKGDFGAVFKASYRGRKVAAKSLQDNSRAAQMFLSEASLMTSLRHQNLVELLGVVLGDTMYIVTEFMAKGNLVDYLRSRGRTVITKKDQINFASDTSEGMAYLESQKVVHRDLAARNVLISDEGVAKVSDFGLARHSDDHQEGGLIPIKWTSPEALRHNIFTNKSDIWSFGVLLWEIYSFGRNPYPRIPVKEVATLVERGYRMGAPEGCPSDIFDIMNSCWEPEPESRPTFEKIRKKLSAMRTSTV
ncbi:tyrosine-protein kinase CSK-like isoform X2 [Tubulanus polymorphus]